MPPGHQGFVLATAFNADGSRLYSASIEGELLEWDMTAGSLARYWSCHDGPINAVAYCPDPELVITAGHDGDVNVWGDGMLIARLEHSHHVGAHSAVVGKDFIAA